MTGDEKWLCYISIEYKTKEGEISKQTKVILYIWWYWKGSAIFSRSKYFKHDTEIYQVKATIMDKQPELLKRNWYILSG